MLGYEEMAILAIDICYWAAVVVGASLVAALPVGLLGRSHRWPADRCRKWAIWSLVAVGLGWCSFAQWVLHKNPVERRPGALGPLAFLLWLILARYMTIRIALRVASPDPGYSAAVTS